MFGLLNQAKDAGSDAYDWLSNKMNNANVMDAIIPPYMATLGHAGAEMLGGRRMAPYGAAAGGALGGYFMNPDRPMLGAGIGGTLGYGYGKGLQGLQNMGDQVMQWPGMRQVGEHLMLEGANQGAQALGNYFYPQNNTAPMGNTTAMQPKFPSQNNTFGGMR